MRLVGGGVTGAEGVVFEIIVRVKIIIVTGSKLKILHFLHYNEPLCLKRHPLCIIFCILHCTNVRQGSRSCLHRQLHKFWAAGLKNLQSYKVQRQAVTRLF